MAVLAPLGGDDLLVGYGNTCPLAVVQAGATSQDAGDRGLGKRVAVVIQLNSIGRGRPEHLRAIVPALAEAAEAVELDHWRLAAVLDWVQYRRNFRAPVMVRPFGRTPGAGPGAPDAPLAEIAIDVRRAKDLPYDAAATAVAAQEGRIAVDPDLRGDSLGSFGVGAVRDSDIVRVPCQPDRGRGADAARAAGDEGNGLEPGDTQAHLAPGPDLLVPAADLAARVGVEPGAFGP
jgi:hypothetical protein